MATQKRAPKGSVSVEAFKGYLRLRWRYQGKRETLYLGRPDTPLDRKLAENKANQIYGDIQTGNYDPTLAKYKPESQLAESITVVEVIQQCRKHKEDLVHSRTLEKYAALANYAATHFKKQKAASVDHEAAVRFKEFLQKSKLTRNGKSLSDRTVKEHIVTIAACWGWAIEQEVLSSNPWETVRKHTKVKPSQKPDPFTKKEVELILKAFEEHPKFRHYLTLVWWQFSMGTRTGEALALSWKHFSNDCSSVWIGESLDRNKVVKAAKMNKARTLNLSEKIQSRILKMKEESKSELVFPAPRGRYIDDSNFSQRVWKPTLKAAGVNHRKFYRTRSTFISHALQSGMHYVDVADFVGDSPETIYKYYVGSIQDKNRAPDLF